MADGDHATCIAMGQMVSEALIAREMLGREGIRLRVVNMHTLKPLDEKRSYEPVARPERS